MRSRIVSVGTAVPETVLTNHELETFLDTSDEWITTRTGIRERRVVSREAAGNASELGAVAAQRALEKLDLAPKDIDGIICASFTPDNFFPSTACVIADKLGCRGAFSFDISAACAGFVYGLNVANALISSGQCRRMLLVGAEVVSKCLDWTDRGTAILFGDGAGAVVLEQTDDPKKGVFSTHMSGDGSLGDILFLRAWGDDRKLRMRGNEVYKHAVRMMRESILSCIEACGMGSDDVDLIVPHQANIRIIQALSRLLQVPMDRIVVNLDRYGNTSSASIPIALEEAIEENRISDGSRVVFASLGGGLVVASAVVGF